MTEIFEEKGFKGDAFSWGFVETAVVLNTAIQILL